MVANYGILHSPSKPSVRLVCKNIFVFFVFIKNIFNKGFAEEFDTCMRKAHDYIRITQVPIDYPERGKFKVKAHRK